MDNVTQEERFAMMERHAEQMQDAVPHEPPANKTCLSYWFPLIEAAGLPVPRTTIIRVDKSRELCRVLDGESPPEFGELCARVKEAADAMGYPCFFRTGQSSNKHSWKDTCFLADPDLIPHHVAALVEWSEICDFMGLPYNVWVVRELLKTAPAFHAFAGNMPIVREFRVFVQDGSLICQHPYWPEGCFGEQPDGPLDQWMGCGLYVDQQKYPAWRESLAAMNTLDYDERKAVCQLATAAGHACRGAWSVDVLQDAAGKWWVTDMAEAALSYHWEGCPEAARFQR